MQSQAIAQSAQIQATVPASSAVSQTTPTADTQTPSQVPVVQTSGGGGEDQTGQESGQESEQENENGSQSAGTTPTQAQATAAAQAQQQAAQLAAQQQAAAQAKAAAQAQAAQSAGRYKDGTYTGSSVNVYYGNVQVQAVVQGGKITAVNFLQYPNDRSTSRYINSQAMPLLQQETLQAQSARVSGVSGASDTSQGFVQSLSAALAQA
jgi:uncharacterized protein with FMN-binding domain